MRTSRAALFTDQYQKRVYDAPLKLNRRDTLIRDGSIK